MINTLLKKILKDKSFHADCPSVLYHSVINNEDSLLGTKYLHNVQPDNFYSQLKNLQKKYKAVFLDEFFELQSKGKFTRGLFTVSFDDGYRSVLTEALPILNDLKIPATVFINSSFLKSPFWRDLVRLIIEKDLEQEFLKIISNKYDLDLPSSNQSFYKLSKDEKFLSHEVMAKEVESFLTSKNLLDADLKNSLYIREQELMHYEYLKIGNHSKQHLLLSGLSKEKQWEEIKETHDLLENKAINRTSCFSIPFGGLNSLNQDTVDILHKLNYKSFVLSNSYNSIDFFERNNQLKLNTYNLRFGSRIMPRDVSKLKLKY